MESTKRNLPSPWSATEENRLMLLRNQNPGYTWSQLALEYNKDAAVLRTQDGIRKKVRKLKVGSILRQAYSSHR